MEGPSLFIPLSLNKSELAQSSIEKEATAIVEAVQKWSYLLIGSLDVFSSFLTKGLLILRMTLKIAVKLKMQKFYAGALNYRNIIMKLFIVREDLMLLLTRCVRCMLLLTR